MSAIPQQTLSNALRERVGKGTSEGAVLRCGEIALRVRKISPSGVIEQIGMMFKSGRSNDEQSCDAADSYQSQRA